MKKDFKSYVNHEFHCGPGNWPHWLKWLLGRKGRNEFCAFHDYRYANPTAEKEEEDLNFFAAMFFSHGKFGRGLIDYIYFYAVFKYGKKSWQNNREKNDDSIS